MKPKEYLLSIGAITAIGRGRLSGEHKAICVKAAGEGIYIEGFSPSSTPPVVTKAPKAKKEPTSVPGEKVIAELNVRFPIDAFEAVEPSGRVRSMKEACICGYSLTGHICDDPRIVSLDGTLGHTPVIIRRQR